MLHWQEMLTHQSQYPTTQTRELLPFSNPCPMISPQLLCCCATLLSVSWMHMKVVQKNEHQMYRAYHLMFTLDLSSLQQLRRLGINLACIHWLCHQHDKTAEHVKCILTYLTSLAKLLPHALFQFVTAPPKALTVHIVAGLSVVVTGKRKHTLLTCDPFVIDSRCVLLNARTRSAAWDPRGKLFDFLHHIRTQLAFRPAMFVSAVNCHGVADRYWRVCHMVMMPRVKSSICNVILMRVIPPSVKNTPFVLETLLFPFLCLSERVAFRSVLRVSSRLLLTLQLSAWVPRRSVCVCVQCMALLVPLESQAAFWCQQIQLRWEEYREFSSSDVQLVFGCYPNPIDALLSFKHFCTEMTALLATSFLVSM